MLSWKGKGLFPKNDRATFCCRAWASVRWVLFLSRWALCGVTHIIRSLSSTHLNDALEVAFGPVARSLNILRDRQSSSFQRELDFWKQFHQDRQSNIKLREETFSSKQMKLISFSFEIDSEVVFSSNCILRTTGGWLLQLLRTALI